MVGPVPRQYRELCIGLESIGFAHVQHLDSRQAWTWRATSKIAYKFKMLSPNKATARLPLGNVFGIACTSMRPLHCPRDDVESQRKMHLLEAEVKLLLHRAVGCSSKAERGIFGHFESHEVL